MAKVYLSLLDLYLDKENPRHDLINDQDEIIAHLVKTEGVKELAKHVAEKGRFSPLDSIGVIEEDGRYVSVEGNRRTCAGILLNDPSRSPKGDEKYFRNLVANATAIPDKIECHIFDTREEAKEWMAIRHNGPQGGIGTVAWNPDQKARFFNNSGTALAIAVLDYATQGGMLSSESREEKRLLTTAARYLNNPVFRSAMGIVSGRSDAKVKINVPVDEFNRVVSRFCRDLLDPESGVTSRSNKEDWKAYAQRLVDEGDAPKTKVEPQELDFKKAKLAPSKTQGARNNYSSDKRKTIIDNSVFKVAIRDKLIKRVFDELRMVDCNSFPLAAVMVCRIFLENTYRAYHERYISHVKDGEEVHITLQKVVRHLNELKNSGQLDRAQKKALGALNRVASNDMNVLSPKTLGAFAHGGHYPDPRSIKIEWDNISEIILFLLRDLAKR
ncbi:hypothetical protein [Pseudomonas sp. NBRC 100443]|uniref:hypothetical protein n=1 Tax=Pseudomonas sp. NBRC 100443 TaxID=1113665 RepID=UPI0024A360D6|nr:hypothetical protein [Pseudomonas sp. NBRC 100443]GLU40070.1 hypothetical protein Pssp01_41630 [Pseudomonas sp. NBRC 100443]